MKTKLLLFLFSLVISVCFGQLQPIDHTPPNADNLKEAAIKINANDTYLDQKIDTTKVRLDSLITAGVGETYTAGSGLTLTGNQFKLGGPMANGVSTINNTAGQDASVEFLVDDGLSGAYLFHTGSNSYTFEGIGQELLSTQGGLYFTGLTFNPNGMLLGMVAYADDTGPKFEFISNGIINVIRIKNIPTSSAACGTDGSGTLYNDAGTLKICP